MHSTPLFALGVFFAFAGLAMFAWTMRKQKAPTGVLRKSDIREQSLRQSETNKLRIGGAVVVAIGAALLMLS